VAKQIITKLLDDLDGGEADETVSFAFDGSEYTIDLSAKNAKKFREIMSQYQEAGTRLGRMGHSAQLRRHLVPATSRSSREDNAKVREWALNNGYELAERGRIPGHIQEAYDKGEPNPAWVAAQKAKALEDEMKPAPRKRAAKATA